MNKVQKGTGIVIKNEKGEYLIIQRADSKELALVGGGIDKGESAEESIIREVKEEIGIDINRNDLQYLGECPSPANSYKKGSIDGVSINYAIELSKTPNITLQEEEIDSYKWVSGVVLDRLLSHKFIEIYPSSIFTLKKYKKINGGL